MDIWSSVLATIRGRQVAGFSMQTVEITRAGDLSVGDHLAETEG
jgi:hypothetical protein